jgi:hypothetical protein
MRADSIPMDFTGNPTMFFALRWTRPVGDPHIGCPRSASRVAGEPVRCHSSPPDSPVRSHLGHLGSSPTLALLFPRRGRRSASTADDGLGPWLQSLQVRCTLTALNGLPHVGRGRRYGRAERPQARWAARPGTNRLGPVAFLPPPLNAPAVYRDLNGRGAVRAASRPTVL